ncbi:MAG: aminopeptidase P family protein [Nitrospirae bacterium]|nr:aminopeptidase P family protein [Nitrospirota bacterium]
MDRLESIKELVSSRRLKAFLVSDLKNVRYLTGFRGSSALLLVTRKEAFFFTDFRYREQARLEVKGCEVIVPEGALLRRVRRTLRRLRVHSLGFEFNAPYSLYHGLKNGFRLRAVRNMVESLRLKKEREEIRLIRTAVKRAEEAFSEIKPEIRRGVTERSVALRLEEALRRRGCQRIPFDIIVASGENAALPHASPSEKRLEPGDLVVVDWGGEAGGYFSDMTRTLLLEGPGMETKMRIYDTVLKANRSAIRAAGAGVKAADVDRAARELIERAGFGDFFGHGTGHGVGLDIHESPRISLISKDILMEGMVFTIEPGVYIPGVGGVRIEDMVCIGEKGPRVLTRLPKRLEVV